MAVHAPVAYGRASFHRGVVPLGPYRKLGGMGRQPVGKMLPPGGWPAGSLLAAVPAVVAEEQGSVLDCSSMDQWRNAEAEDYKGMRVARGIDPMKWQFVADQLAQRVEDMDDGLHIEKVDVGAEASRQRRLQEAAQTLASYLPPALAQVVRQDAEALANATCDLVPEAQELVMGLKIFGRNVCSRWHQDHIVCRAIVAYNCSGTVYTDDSNVDFYELNNCGKEDCILHDKARVQNLNVGDILIMKGKLFPGKARGLVHRSPEVLFHGNGKVRSRLVLTVEVSRNGKGEQ